MANTKKKVIIEVPAALVDTVSVPALDPTLDAARAVVETVTAEFDKRQAIKRQLDRFSLVFARTLLSALGALAFGTLLYVALFDTAHVHVYTKDRPAFFITGGLLAVLFLLGMGATTKRGLVFYDAIGKRMVSAVLAVPDRVRPFVAIILALLVVAVAVSGFVFLGR